MMTTLEDWVMHRDSPACDLLNRFGQPVHIVRHGYNYIIWRDGVRESLSASTLGLMLSYGPDTQVQPHAQGGDAR